VQYKNIYMLAMTRKNANVTIALLFMYKVMEILKAYVGSVEVRALAASRSCCGEATTGSLRAGRKYP
jgi:hypothetical protein